MRTWRAWVCLARERTRACEQIVPPQPPELLVVPSAQGGPRFLESPVPGEERAIIVWPEGVNVFEDEESLRRARDLP
jgi:hypothetical protein